MKKLLLKLTIFTFIGVFILFLSCLAQPNANFRIIQSAQAQGSNSFGEIEITPGAEQWGEGAIVAFINAAIKFIIALAGSWLLIKIIVGSIKIIGNTKDPASFFEEIKKIGWTIFGLLLVATSYVIVSWASKSLFGDDTYILDFPQHFVAPELGRE